MLLFYYSQQMVFEQEIVFHYKHSLEQTTVYFVRTFLTLCLFLIFSLSTQKWKASYIYDGTNTVAYDM